MAERKTVWLNVYGRYPDIEAYLSEDDANLMDAETFRRRQGPAVEVSLIRTADGWKQDDTAGRIEGLREALHLCRDGYDSTYIRKRIAQLEAEAQYGN